MIYAIMVRPNHNLAYMQTYLRMCTFELQVLMQYHHYDMSTCEVINENKATLIRFESEQAISDEIALGIYQLSFFHTIFQVISNEVTGELYKGVNIMPPITFEDDLSIRLKYNGKTNEQITRMMLNIAYYSSQFCDLPVREIRLLDPLCGRGTSLFEGMIKGFHVYGIEQDRKSVSEMEAYITRYLREAKMKHKKHKGKVLVEGKVKGDTFSFDYAVDKASFKAKKLQVLKVVRGDTQGMQGVFKKDSMHLILADLPYNIQHSLSDSKTLLHQGLKVWTPFLKVGGVIAISWNLHTNSREDLCGVLDKHGYQVLYTYDEFDSSHRVSQAIQRDLLFAMLTDRI